MSSRPVAPPRATLFFVDSRTRFLVLARPLAILSSCLPSPYIGGGTQSAFEITWAPSVLTPDCGQKTNSAKICLSLQNLLETGYNPGIKIGRNNDSRLPSNQDA